MVKYNTLTSALEEDPKGNKAYPALYKINLFLF
jgi:hypothetical protein